MNIGTDKFGFETISTIGAALWGNLQNDIKNSDSLIFFKHKIKHWAPGNCPCYICRNFINNLGYIWKPHIYAPILLLRSTLCFFTLFDPRVSAGQQNWKLKKTFPSPMFNIVSSLQQLCQK